MDAHHVFPKKFSKNFSSLGIDNQQAIYGAWVDSSTHRSFSYAYNKAWSSFFAGNPTMQGAFELAKSLAKQYGYNVLF